KVESVCSNLQYLSPPRKQGPRWRVGLRCSRIVHGHIVLQLHFTLKGDEVSAAMTVTVSSIPVLASSGGFFLVQGEGLHDDVRTARCRAPTGPSASPFRAALWAKGSSGAIADLSQWFALRHGPQECRADSFDLRRTGRQGHRP